MKNIIIYTLNYCPYCKKAVRTLLEKNITFSQIDVTNEEDKYSKNLKKKYDIAGEVTYPQIIIDDKRFGGNDLLQNSIKNNTFDKIFR